MQIRAGILLCLIGLFAGASSAAPPLAGEPVGGERWPGLQVVQADRSGNVYFLRGESYSVYPVGKKGMLGEPVKLERTVQGPAPRIAVMSPSGRQWLMVDGPRLRFFEDGKEKTLPPLNWPPQSIGFRRDVPVVTTLPIPLTVQDKEGTELPFLVELSGDRWSVVTRFSGVTPDVAAAALKDGSFNDLFSSASVSLTSDRQGRLWVSNQYGYKIQRLSPGGKVLFTLSLDGGKPHKKREVPSSIEIKRSAGQNPVSATTNPKEEKGTFHPFAYSSVIYASCEGRDGNLYFLTAAADDNLALDRYNFVESTLERAALSLPWKGSTSMAAGKDALYFAAYNGEKGRSRIAWDALEQAVWRKLDFESAASDED